MLHSSALLAFERGMSEQARHQPHLHTQISQTVQQHHHKPLTLHYSSPPETTSCFGFNEEPLDETAAVSGEKNAAGTESCDRTLPASYAAVVAKGGYAGEVSAGSGFDECGGRNDSLGSHYLYNSANDVSRLLNDDSVANQQQFSHPAAKKDKLTMLLEERVPDSVSSFVNDPGMMMVPLWLKSLRLHKYQNLFARLSYGQMLALDEDMLTATGMTQGARKKIIGCIQKLHERTSHLERLEYELVHKNENPKTTLYELCLLINTPIQPFVYPSLSAANGETETNVATLAASTIDWYALIGDRVSSVSVKDTDPNNLAGRIGIMLFKVFDAIVARRLHEKQQQQTGNIPLSASSSDITQQALEAHLYAANSYHWLLNQTSLAIERLACIRAFACDTSLLKALLLLRCRCQVLCPVLPPPSPVARDAASAGIGLSTSPSASSIPALLLSSANSVAPIRGVGVGGISAGHMKLCRSQTIQPKSSNNNVPGGGLPSGFSASGHAASHLARYENSRLPLFGTSHAAAVPSSPAMPTTNASNATATSSLFAAPCPEDGVSWRNNISKNTSGEDAVDITGRDFGMQQQQNHIPLRKHRSLFNYPKAAPVQPSLIHSQQHQPLMRRQTTRGEDDVLFPSPPRDAVNLGGAGVIRWRNMQTSPNQLSEINIQQNRSMQTLPVAAVANSNSSTSSASSTGGTMRSPTRVQFATPPTTAGSVAGRKPLSMSASLTTSGNNPNAVDFSPQISNQYPLYQPPASRHHALLTATRSVNACAGNSSNIYTPPATRHGSNASSSAASLQQFMRQYNDMMVNVDSPPPTPLRSTQQLQCTPYGSSALTNALVQQQQQRNSGQSLPMSVTGTTTTTPVNGGCKFYSSEFAVIPEHSGHSGSSAYQQHSSSSCLSSSVSPPSTSSVKNNTATEEDEDETTDDFSCRLRSPPHRHMALGRTHSEPITRMNQPPFPLFGSKQQSTHVGVDEADMFNKGESKAVNLVRRHQQLQQQQPLAPGDGRRKLPLSSTSSIGCGYAQPPRRWHSPFFASFDGSTTANGSHNSGESSDHSDCNKCEQSGSDIMRGGGDFNDESGSDEILSRITGNSAQLSDIEHKTHALSMTIAENAMEETS